MTVSEYKLFASAEPPKDKFVCLMVYPNNSMARYAFDLKMNELKISNKQFEASLTKLSIVSPEFGEIRYVDVSNHKVLQQVKASDVYVHPTIKEIAV